MAAAVLKVESASPVWYPNTPYDFAPEKLIDGNEDRDQNHKSCYHTIQYGDRPVDEKTPYANYSMDLMKVDRVELLTRNNGGVEQFG